MYNNCFKDFFILSIMYFDAHVHDRGGKQAYKGETPAHALEVARDSGVDGIIVMPNTDPALLNKDLIEERYKEAIGSGIKDVYYGIWMGLTKDSEQIKRAVQTAKELDYVVGFKLYAGHSTGNLGVVQPSEQFNVFETLVHEGYDGPLVVHCEKESRINESLFSADNPFTHTLARPSIAETESVSDIINFAYLTGFKGKLHITHVSTNEAVNYIAKAREEGMNISCDVTPHHLFYSADKLAIDKGGLLFKMNPPLRESFESVGLLRRLFLGDIDFIATDHAPHSIDDKQIKCASGVPALAAWPLFAEYLEYLGFDKKRIEEVTFSKAVSRFGLPVDRKERSLKNHRGDYSYDPWESLDTRLIELRGKS